MSKYLELFKQKNFDLLGSRVIVEVLPKDDITTAGGLIIASAESYREQTKDFQPVLGLVLAVGEGYSNDDGTVTPVDLKPGNIVWFNQMGMAKYTQLPGGIRHIMYGIGIIRENDCHGVWQDIEAFKQWKTIVSTVQDKED